MCTVDPGPQIDLMQCAVIEIGGGSVFCQVGGTVGLLFVGQVVFRGRHKALLLNGSHAERKEMAVEIDIAAEVLKVSSSVNRAARRPG